jgi:twitching motility protein PilU
LATLALPSVPSALIADASGLVLVAGARGSGRSTSLAMMLQHRLATRRGHALTIEHPIEHVLAPTRATSRNARSDRTRRACMRRSTRR